MNWSDERYVRLYTRDTADWLALSFDAQALLAMLLRKVDRAGVLELGRHGRRAVALTIGHPHIWDRLEPALAELERDGCVEITGNRLVFRNFIAAQEALASDRMRKRESRERRRDESRAVAASGAEEPEPHQPRAEGVQEPLRAIEVTKRDRVSQNVTESHAESHAVTSGHAESREVTPCRAVPYRTKEDPATGSGEPAGEGVSRRGSRKAQNKPLPFKASELFAVLAESLQGRWSPGPPMTKGEAIAINQAIRRMELAEYTLADVRLAAEYHLAARPVGEILGPSWAAANAGLIAEISKARTWVAGGRKPVHWTAARGVPPPAVGPPPVATNQAAVDEFLAARGRDRGHA